MSKQSLGHWLVESAALKPEELAALGSKADGDNQILAEALLSASMLDEGTICAALAQSQEHPALVMAESIIDLRPLASLPQDVAYSHLVLPVAFDAQSITVACVDPSDRAILDQIAYATARRVTPLLAIAAILKEAIPAAYGFAQAGQTFLRGREVLSTMPDQVHLAVMRPSFAPQMLEEITDDPADALPPLAPPRPKTSVSATEELEDGVLELSDEAASAPAPSGPFILVVEDDDDIRGLLERVLAHDGHLVHTISSGTEALAFLRANRPQLVLLDAMLPGVHGFEICAHIKNSVALNSVAVIMISAVYRGLENSREIQEQHGANAFIEKPFEIPYLRKKVGEFMGTPVTPSSPKDDQIAKLQETKQAAHLAYKAGDLELATTLLGDWTAVDPFDPAAYFLLGNLHNKSGDHESAMKAYERASTFDPLLFGAMKNLAVVYEKLGFISRARSTWKKARDLTEDEGVKAQITERLEKRFR